MASSDRPKVKLTPSSFDLIAMGVVVVSVLYAGMSLAAGYGELPDRIPTHFNATGEPDGYGSPRSRWMLFGVQMSIAIGVWVLSYFPHMHNYMVEITEENAERVYSNSVSLLHGVNAICCSYFAYMIVTNLSIAKGELNGLGSLSMVLFMVTLFGLIGYFIWRIFCVQ